MAEPNETTVIAAETHIKGELTFEGAARIIGRVEGQINAKGDLHIAQRGQCKAHIEAENVMIDGTIEGDLKVAQRVELNAHGKVVGDIVAEKMVTAEGASLQGHVNIGPGAGKINKNEAKNTMAGQVTINAGMPPKHAQSNKQEPVAIK